MLAENFRGPRQSHRSGGLRPPTLTPRPPLPPALTPARERGRHRPKHCKSERWGFPLSRGDGSAGGRGGQGVRVFGWGKTPPPPDFDGTPAKHDPQWNCVRRVRYTRRPVIGGG